MQMMIKGVNEYKWTPEANHVFHKMKKLICSSPVRALPVDRLYYVDTDASEVAIAGILHQEQPWADGLKNGSLA